MCPARRARPDPSRAPSSRFAASAIALWGLLFLLERTVGLPSVYYRRETEVLGIMSAGLPLVKRLAMGPDRRVLSHGLALVPVLPSLPHGRSRQSPRARHDARGHRRGRDPVSPRLVVRKMLPVTGNIIGVNGLER